MVKYQHKGYINFTLTGEAKYRINFRESRKRFVLSMHYNGSNSFLFFDAIKIYQFRAKDLEIKYPLCLGNISKDFILNNMKKGFLNSKLERGWKILQFTEKANTFHSLINLSIYVSNVSVTSRFSQKWFWDAVWLISGKSLT